MNLPLKISETIKRLSEPARITAYVYPARILSSCASPAPGTLCYTTGWGDREDWEYSREGFLRLNLKDRIRLPKVYCFQNRLTLRDAGRVPRLNIQ